jgi:exodeoxyribonuclease VIII
MLDVMIDLETMGNGSSAAIIAIGAVEFDMVEGTLGNEFYSVVDLDSSVQSGGVIDASTVLWWMTQSDEARKEFARPGSTIIEALLLFDSWMCEVGAWRVWGNGAAFDNVILAGAYRRLGMKTPWKYSGDRCFRTARDMAPAVDMSDYQGVAHNALSDAKWQATYMIRMGRGPA